MVYITSDTHFCHNKDFLYGPRGFKTVYDMNQAIVENWNKTVNNDDTVYLLGDVMLVDNIEGARLLKSLKGNIYIILGNHDTDTRWDIYEDCYNVRGVEYGAKLKYNGYKFYLSHYPTLTSNFDFDKPLGARIINLCGHSHTQNRFEDWDRYQAPIYHCELDAHNCTPVSIEQIIEDIKVH